jgi:biotin synthase
MIRRALAAGFEVCCGGLFGLGETWEDRVDLALELRSLGVRSVPLNFLAPIPGTPLAGQPLLPPREALRIIALFRIALPTVDLRVCGGRPLILRDLQSWIFRAGATSMMIGDYLTTTGRAVSEDLQMLADLGLTTITVPELL